MKSNNQPKDGMDFLYERYIAGHPDRIARFEVEKENVEVAMKIYELRKKAGLTQKELAKRVGNTASVISRLEDANYEGHSMAMLRRIAGALGQRVKITFEPVKKEKATK